MHEQDHPPRLHERHAGAGVSPLPPHRARRPAFPGQTYKKQEESVALLLGILPLVADQRGGFFFSAGIGRGAGLDRRPAAPDVGPGGQIFGSAYPTGGRGCFEASGRCAPGARRLRRGSPTFFEESRRKEHQGGRGSSSLDPPFLVWGDPAGVLLLFLPGLRPICPTPVTARPPAGRAGRGGFTDGKGHSYPQSLPLGGKVGRRSRVG